MAPSVVVAWLAGMSVLTDKELDCLARRRLFRIAIVELDGQPRVVPTSSRYDAVDAGGLQMSRDQENFAPTPDMRHVRIPVQSGQASAWLPSYWASGSWPSVQPPAGPARERLVRCDG